MYRKEVIFLVGQTYGLDHLTAGGFGEAMEVDLRDGVTWNLQVDEIGVIGCRTNVIRQDRATIESQEVSEVGLSGCC